MTFLTIYQLKILKYNIEDESLTSSENLNLYLQNNEYILHYNNKIISIKNIDLKYDENTNELIITSLNRYFIGVVIFKKDNLEFTFNIICNPKLCRLLGFPDIRQTSYKIGSMGSFRMQFSNTIQNAHKRTAGRRTVFIDQRNN